MASTEATRAKLRDTTAKQARAWAERERTLGLFNESLTKLTSVHSSYMAKRPIADWEPSWLEEFDAQSKETADFARDEAASNKALREARMAVWEAHQAINEEAA